MSAKKFTCHSTDPKIRPAALIAVDNSMGPVLLVGDVAFYDPEGAYGDGDIVLVRMPDGEHYFREYRAMDDGTFEVSSLQPAKTWQSANQAIAILGRVTQRQRNFPSRASVSSSNRTPVRQM